jgi:enterochelin esterase-like enzyme
MNDTSPFSRFQTPLRPARRRSIISHHKLDQSPQPTRLLMVASLAVVVLFVVAVLTLAYALNIRSASAGNNAAVPIQVVFYVTPAAPAHRVASAIAAPVRPAMPALANARREWLAASPRREISARQASPTPLPTPTTASPFASAPAAIARPQPAPVTACAQPTGQLVTEVLASKVTVVPIVVHVYLPPCYDPEHHVYPTLYLIHGTAYEQGGWLRNGVPQVADIQMSLGVLPPFIIVMPGADMRAGEASKYSWTNTGRGSYDDFLVNELVPYIDANYSTWASREGRAIGGISRGGYWAIEIGFAHPDLFSVVGGHSPSVFSKLVGIPPNFSMLNYAPSVDALRTLRIWLDAGNEDWARWDMKKLTDDLDAAGVPYTVDIGSGGHEDGYWTSRVPEYLAFYAADWPRAARAKQALAANP